MKKQKEKEKFELKSVLVAFSPFILILVIIIGISPLFPGLYNKLSEVRTSVSIYTGVGAKPYTFCMVNNSWNININSFFYWRVYTKSFFLKKW